MPNVLKSLFIILLSTAGAFAHADEVRGFLHKENGIRSLIVQDENGLESQLGMAGATPEVEGDLQRLKNGDYLVARGSITGSSVQIQAIESLGLQALVGVWSSPENEVYEFKDFSRMNLYIPNDTHSDVVKAGEFQYSVAPDQGTRYSIFLSNSDSVTLGSIEFKKHHVVLNVIDPKTGQVSADIVLSPLASSPPLK